ncbi:arginyl-tRNA synthetase [Hasllibacter halocynthiae]|uniref:Arginine--tRNA ligase n=1 Tax=Hasllibacter halocynthiae TaxID=595589 RepID=A0A2T0X2B1_9RHOB|nr:arginine--tRNA ligase [Hasllibacter halocynthiae]PRY93080.1 arginyl-tRNA synthetase [Hasllibacter halocynthiae]
MTLQTAIESKVRSAFEAAGFDPALGTVRPSDRPDLADFQCNGCLAAAKRYRMAPQAAYEKVAAHLEGGFETAFAPPGFLNVRVTEEGLLGRAASLAGDPRFGAGTPAEGRRLLLDYGGPNVAKEMHVGHLRSSLIGEGLRRLLAFAGAMVEGDVHLGDWGLQMGQVIAWIEEDVPEALDGAPFDMDDLRRWYPAASARSKEDEEFLARARRVTAALQAGEPRYRAIWDRMMEVSKAGLRRDFDRLGVGFEYWYGESRYQGMLDGMVDDLLARGVAEEDDGAVIIRFEEKLPPLILRNSRGGYGYGATDLATIKDRVDEGMAGGAPDAMLYVVDARQKLHFRQVFAAAGRAGYVSRDRLEHIAFGTVNGPDGKPFKTRAGGVMRLKDLADMMLEAATERLKERGEVDTDTAEQVAMAAVKFGELSHDREQNYVFDVDAFTRFEGRTGPYLQYTAVRLESLRAKAAEVGIEPGAPTLGTGTRELILALDAFPAQLDRAVAQRKPSVLAMHAYDVANRINACYAANRILGAEDGAGHLALLLLARRQLVLILGILGIEVPAEM